MELSRLAPADGPDATAGLPRLPASSSDSRAGAARPPRPVFPWVTRLLLPGLLVIAFAGLLAYAAGGALVPATDVRVIPVVVRSVPGQAAPVPGTTPADAGGAAVAQATGWLEPDPYPVVVNALAGGVVRKILVLEGDAVEAGQPVARLIADDAALALRRAEAVLAGANARLEAARRRWDNPTDRTRAVATAEARVAGTEAGLAKLASDVEAAAARAGEAEDLFRQVETTSRRDAASAVERVTARQRMLAQRADLAAVRAGRAVLDAQLRANRADLAAAAEDARLRIEETAAVDAAEAEVAEAGAARDEAALRLERMTVRSPVAGVVMSRHADAGSKVMLDMDHPLSAAVVRLFDPNDLQARVDVPLADVAKVGVGMSAEVAVSVLPDRVFDGRVTRVMHEADVARNTLQVKVSLDDPHPSLKPEMLARVKFFEPQSPGAPGGEASERTIQAVFAPAALIVGEGEAAAAWVVDAASGEARLRSVTLGGGREGAWVEVAAGLVPGDRLIANPAGLKNGGRVRITGEADVPAREGGRDGVH